MNLTQSETSPPRPFRPNMAARRRASSRSDSGERRKLNQKPVKLKLSGAGKQRASPRPPSPGIAGRMGMWAAQRSPSPAVQRMNIGEHKVVMPVISDSDGRLQALEQQRAVDHAFLEQMAAALRVVNQTMDEERDKRLNLEAEIVKVEFQRRQDMAGQKEQTLAEIPNRMAKFVSDGLGPKLDDKFAEANQLLVKLENDVKELRIHESKVEEYLKGLEQDRPREGQAIQQLVQTEVGQVRDLVQKFETSGQAVPRIGLNVVPFTAEMLDSVRGMETKLLTVDQVIGNYNLLADKLNTTHAGFLDHHGRLAAAETRITTAEAQLAAHDVGLFVQSEQHAAPPMCTPPMAQQAAPVSTLNLSAAFQTGIAAAAPQTGACCSGPACQGPTLAGSTAAPPGIALGGAPGSSGDGNPMGAVLRSVTSGNGVCHCTHVTKLIEQVAALER